MSACLRIKENPALNGGANEQEIKEIEKRVEKGELTEEQTESPAPYLSFKVSKCIQQAMLLGFL